MKADAKNELRPCATAAPGYSLRLWLLLGMLMGQALVMVAFFHPYASPNHELASILSIGFAFGLHVLAWLVVFFCPSLPQARTAVVNGMHRRSLRGPVAAQLAGYAVMFYVAVHLIPNDFIGAQSAPAGSLNLFSFTVLLLCILAAVHFSLLMFVPLSSLRNFLATNGGLLLRAFMFALVSYAMSFTYQQSWTSLSTSTIKLSELLLGIVYAEVSADYANSLLGVPGFIVEVGPACSGYEGVGLMMLFMSGYVFVFRSSLRFPAALLLVPLGMALSWVANSFRIAILIAIGASVSPSVAERGFHSNAGVLAFVLLSVALVYVSRKLPVLRRTGPAGPVVLDSESASVIPQLVLFATALLTALVSSGFDWLYPMRIITVGLCIGLLWQHIGPLLVKPSVQSICAGFAVFVFWIAVVTPSPERDALFVEQLFGAPAAAAYVWIVARLLGSALMVPIVEELAFRRYLPQQLDRYFKAATREGKDGQWLTRASPWLTMAISSVLFGALHANWFAGTVAGAAYYFVQRKRGCVADAIAAHATTNLCLSLYAVSTGSWAYW